MRCKEATIGPVTTPRSEFAETNSEARLSDGGYYFETTNSRGHGRMHLEDDVRGHDSGIDTDFDPFMDSELLESLGLKDV